MQQFEQRGVGVGQHLIVFRTALRFFVHLQVPVAKLTPEGTPQHVDHIRKSVGQEAVLHILHKLV